MGHAPSPSDLSKRLGEEGRIVSTLNQAGSPVFGNVLLGSEVVLNFSFVQFESLGFLLKFLRKVDGGLNVLVLRALVIPSKQDDDFNPVRDEIDAIAWPAMNSQLRNTVANGSTVTEIVVLHSMDPGRDSLIGPRILQATQPSIEFVGGQDRLYLKTIAMAHDM